MTLNEANEKAKQLGGIAELLSRRWSAGNVLIYGGHVVKLVIADIGWKRGETQRRWYATRVIRRAAGPVQKPTGEHRRPQALAGKG